MNEERVDIVFTMCIVLVLWSMLVTYAVVQMDRKLNDLQASYEATDTELYNLSAELNDKGIFDGKKD